MHHPSRWRTSSIFLIVLCILFLMAGCARNSIRTTKVTVAGEAISRVEPDTAVVSLSVVTQSPQALTAQQENARKSEAVANGFDEAIMLDPTGYVAECTGENIFVVRKEVIYTVPRASILEGITRDSLITIAGDMGYTVVEEPISRDQLYIADEVFVCGTAAEVIGLREIDFRTVGSGKTGPVTRALQKAFDELTSGRHARSEQWFSLVPALDPAAVKA